MNTDTDVSLVSQTQDIDVVRSEKAKKQTRLHGKFIKKEVVVESPSIPTPASSPNPIISLTEDKTKPKLGPDDPPLVDLKVTNPVKYFKNWWKKIIGNEGIEMKWSLKIKPLTAFLLLAFIVSGGITINLLNRIKESTPVVGKYLPAYGSDGLREAAFAGTVEVSSKGTYFLITATESIILSESSGISLKYFLDKEILATGRYDSEKNELIVEEIKNLEVSNP